MSRWFILRTSGGQTLPLMRSLREAGFDVWSPARTIRRVLYPGKRAERRDEIDVPILPTFVFANEVHFEALAELAHEEMPLHPMFSVFQRHGESPFVSAKEIVGLRLEEERAAATMQAMRDAESYEAAEKIRIEALKTEAARRRATKELERAKLAQLRSKPIALPVDTEVDVLEMPAFKGVTGVIEATRGSVATVRFGNLSWKVDGWRLTPTASRDKALRGIAA